MPKLLSLIHIGVCLFLCVSAQNINKVVLSKDYGVKLCGREFIRAVIFTCGGSRWKRAMDLDVLLSRNTEITRDFLKPPTLWTGNSGKADPVHLGSLTAASGQAAMLLNAPSADLTRAAEQATPPSSASSFFSLADVLKMLEDQKQAGAESSERPLRASLSSQLEVAPSSLGLGQDTNIPWLYYDRRKRNFSHGLAGICCNQGCTKNDIGRLC